MAQRSVQVLLTAAWIGSGLLYDRITGSLQRNAPLRAAQVLTISWHGPCVVIVSGVVQLLLQPCRVQSIIFTGFLAACRCGGR